MLKITFLKEIYFKAVTIMKLIKLHWDIFMTSKQLS